MEIFGLASSKREWNNERKIELELQILFYFILFRLELNERFEDIDF